MSDSLTNTNTKSVPEQNEQPTYMRRIRSFVLREGRLTKAQQHALDHYWPNYGLDYQTKAFDLTQIFGRDHYRVLEIGFGMGQSLVQMAADAPTKDFIGIEVHRPGVGACLATAKAQGLTNIKLIQHDAVEVLEHSIADNSLDTVQLFFPDPWHKKRHHKRRIVQPEFVQLVLRKLKPSGIFHMATDWQDYAEQMLEVMQQAPGYSNMSANNDYVARPEHRPLTKFEQRGQRLGHGVWDLMYKKDS